MKEDVSIKINLNVEEMNMINRGLYLYEKALQEDRKQKGEFTPETKKTFTEVTKLDERIWRIKWGVIRQDVPYDELEEM